MHPLVSGASASFVLLSRGWATHRRLACARPSHHPNTAHPSAKSSKTWHTTLKARAMRGAATQAAAAAAAQHCGAQCHKPIRLAIVGDVHGQWDEDSEAALDSLAADVAIFLGDFGEEDIEIIQRIAAVRHRKAVILGNHDAWYSLTERGRTRLARKLAVAPSATLPPGALGPGPMSKSSQRTATAAAAVEAAPEGAAPGEGPGVSAQAAAAAAVPAGAATYGKGGRLSAAAAAGGNRRRDSAATAGAGGSGSAVTPGVARQLELLGNSHVGFAAAHFADINLSIVGGRPFTKGGKQWSDVAAFYQALYGVSSPAEAAQRIAAAAASQPEGCVRVVAAHNGPAGLGGSRHDICGVDWLAGEGDHGDPDLQAALATLHQQGVAIPLVLFGHMHSGLKGGGQRNMAQVDPVTSTVLLNCAVVPRMRGFTMTREEALKATHRLGAASSALGRCMAAASGDEFMSGGSAMEGGRYEENGDVSGEQGQRWQQQQQQQQQEGLEQADRSPKRSRVVEAERRRQQQQHGVAEQHLGSSRNGNDLTGRGCQEGSLVVEGQTASSPGRPAEQAGQQRAHAQLQQQQQEQEHGPQPSNAGADRIEGRAHHFVVVELEPSGVVLSARNVWVAVLPTSGEPPAGGSRHSAGHAAGNGTPAGSSHKSGLAACGQGPKQCFVLEEQDLVLLRRQAAQSETERTLEGNGLHVDDGQVMSGGAAAGAAVYEVYRAHEGKWETVQCGGLAVGS